MKPRIFSFLRGRGSNLRSILSRRKIKTILVILGVNVTATVALFAAANFTYPLEWRNQLDPQRWLSTLNGGTYYYDSLNSFKFQSYAFSQARSLNPALINGGAGAVPVQLIMSHKNSSQKCGYLGDYNGESYLKFRNCPVPEAAPQVFYLEFVNPNNAMHLGSENITYNAVVAPAWKVALNRTFRIWVRHNVNQWRCLKAVTAHLNRGYIQKNACDPANVNPQEVFRLSFQEFTNNVSTRNYQRFHLLTTGYAGGNVKRPAYIANDGYLRVSNNAFSAYHFHFRDVLTDFAIANDNSNNNIVTKMRNRVTAIGTNWNNYRNALTTQIAAFATFVDQLRNNNNQAIVTLNAHPEYKRYMRGLSGADNALANLTNVQLGNLTTRNHLLNLANTSHTEMQTNRNIVLVISDTLRADAVNARLTPFIHNWKGDATEPPYTQSGSSTTNPSTFSLYNGLPAMDMHYLRNNAGNQTTNPAHFQFPIMFEVLGKLGYNIHLYSRPYGLSGIAYQKYIEAYRNRNANQSNDFMEYNNGGKYYRFKPNYKLTYSNADNRLRLTVGERRAALGGGGAARMTSDQFMHNSAFKPFARKISDCESNEANIDRYFLAENIYQKFTNMDIDKWVTCSFLSDSRSGQINWTEKNLVVVFLEGPHSPYSVNPGMNNGVFINPRQAGANDYAPRDVEYQNQPTWNARFSNKLMDNHTPISLRKKRMVDGYYQAVKQVDFRFKEVHQELIRVNKYDDSFLIFTSDHGESLFENGVFRHSGPPMQKLSEVPLYVKYPQTIRSYKHRSHMNLFPLIIRSLHPQIGTELFRFYADDYRCEVTTLPGPQVANGHFPYGPVNEFKMLLRGNYANNNTNQLGNMRKVTIRFNDPNDPYNSANLKIVNITDYFDNPIDPADWNANNHWVNNQLRRDVKDCLTRISN